MYAFHGVYDEERRLGNHFEVSLTLHYPVKVDAFVYDQLDGTLNYAAVIDVVKEVMAQPSRLLERVAYKMREALKTKFPGITGGTICIAKLSPPLPVDLDYVAVSIAI